MAQPGLLLGAKLQEELFFEKEHTGSAKGRFVMEKLEGRLKNQTRITQIFTMFFLESWY